MKHNYAIVTDNANGAGEADKATASSATSRPVTTSEQTHYSYIDCLKGNAPVPLTPNGKTLFQVLMVGGMVTFMVTTNGIAHTGIGFLAQSHWLYPLMFALAFLVRTFISSPLVDKLAPKLVFGHLEGVGRSIGMTVLNVACTAPIMCALATMLLVGVDNFLPAYLTKLPAMALIAAVVNFFIVGPIVKIAYNRIAPADGLGLLAGLRQNVPALTQLLGF